MKKLSFNSTLNHKRDSYDTYEVSVEKVITLCGDEFSAHYSRAHNNANVLTLGARVIGEGLAENIVDIFLNSSFEGGRHARRIDKITETERMKSCTNL